MSAESRDDATDPDLEATPQPFAPSRPEIHFAARCADVEEFIVSFEAFVDGDTLVLPHHPRLPPGTEGHFTIALRSGGAAVLRGRCRALEVLSYARGVRRANRAIRVRVLDLDEGCRTVHQRLQARGRFHDDEQEPRLARLHMLLQVVAPPPRPAPARAVSRPPIPLRPPLLAPLPPLEAPASPPDPAPGVARTTTPVAVLDPPRSPGWRRAREVVARSEAAVRRWVVIIRPVLRRHRKLIAVGAISFVLGFAARGGSRAEPPPAAPPLPALPALVSPPVREAPPPDPMPPPPAAVAETETVVRVAPVCIPPPALRRTHRKPPAYQR
jgi:hypothetical protein